uniref:GPI ethanolamine phosphate transferase 2 C-terminal domain-containing protein n=1 Tax=Ditylenchus dipsaci TaxID=166011 RepID=A0A915EE77_9BILA
MSRWKWISVGLILQFGAIFLFGMGFLPQRPSKTVVEPKSRDNPSESFEVCHAKHRSPLKNLVIMVIDAFRDEFLLKSPTMKITRAMIGRGEAKVFRAHVQQPTVTTPRIKALLSGTVPLFSELILNFASNEYLEDNWLRRAKEDDKRILFFGDEVWLEMLPNSIFEDRSEGVDSFFVKDYTEVDTNVSRHLDKELSLAGLETWDVLILHFLGLDHIGHSLGGDHPQIDIKLKQMDEIIYKISQSLLQGRPKPGEFALFVLGDHGMSLEGNHGGNSDLETHVPVLVVKNDMKKSDHSKNTDIIPELSIEQIDLNPVWCALLNLKRIPFENLGVSFLPLIEPNWRIALSGFRQNVKQFIEFLEAYYSGRNEELLASLTECITEIDKLCVIKEPKILENQALFLHMTTDFDHWYLCVICWCFVPSFGHCFGSISFCGFVEEEHDIWYFLLPLLVSILLWHHVGFALSENEQQKISNQTYLGRSRLIFYGNGKWLVFILVAHRLARSTFETQRRRWVLFAEGKTFDCGLDIFFSTKALLPAVIGFFSVFVIKLPIFELSSNVLLWKFIQVCIIWMLLSRNFSMAISLWLFFVIKPTLSHLFVASWMIGNAIGKLKHLKIRETILFLHCSMSAAFFYTGNTNSVSSLDISVGYAGLSSYQPVLVGSQILLNTYLGPICVFLGWYHATNHSNTTFPYFSHSISGEKAAFLNNEFFSNAMPTLLLLRSYILLTCLISLFMFRHHLFVWSVFAPKLLYEIVHLSATTFVAVVNSSLRFMETNDLWKHTWPSSFILCEFIASNSRMWEGKSILELGAGTSALPSMTSLRCGAKSVCITEQSRLTEAFKYIERNVRRNFPEGTISSTASIMSLDWGCEKSIHEFISSISELDYILGSDVFFDPSVFSLLIHTIRKLLDAFPSAEFYFAYQVRDSDWTIEDLLLLNKLECSSIQLVDTEKHTIHLGKIYTL